MSNLKILDEVLEYIDESSSINYEEISKMCDSINKKYGLKDEYILKSINKECKDGKIKVLSCTRDPKMNDDKWYNSFNQDVMEKFEKIISKYDIDWNINHSEKSISGYIKPIKK